MPPSMAGRSRTRSKVWRTSQPTDERPSGLVSRERALTSFPNNGAGTRYREASVASWKSYGRRRSPSGISIANPDLPSHPSGSSATTNSSNKKPKTRGRGRRGEIETGASKSVVLERAAEFVQWMADGNFALTNEIKRLESILQNHGIHV
ncbi:hypothetical protein Pst134EB_008271 [Puccinia striiformis f. sp. tritici]|nr:hypothetical protein Pst134EB_008271 [Puccinia striiformis f. sp. tritici]